MARLNQPFPASATQHSVLTSAICSGVLHLIAVSAGLAITIARHLRARDRDVEPVLAVQELDVPRQVLLARCRHRDDDQLGFLALELVDGADARAGRQPL